MRLTVDRHVSTGAAAAVAQVLRHALVELHGHCVPALLRHARDQAPVWDTLCFRPWSYCEALPQELVHCGLCKCHPI